MTTVLYSSNIVGFTAPRNIFCDSTGEHVYLSSFSQNAQYSIDFGQSYNLLRNTSGQSNGFHLNEPCLSFTDSYNSFYYSTNFGISFITKTNIPNTPTPKILSRSATCISSDAKYIYVGVNEAGVYRSTNGGNTWDLTSLPDNNTMVWHGFAMSATGNIVYVLSSNNPGFYVSTDYGVTWRLTGALARIEGWYFVNNFVACDSTGQYVAVCSRGNGKLSISTNAGSTWNNIDNITQSKSAWALCMTRDGKQIFTCTYDGDIYVTYNYGVSMKKVFTVSGGIWNFTAIAVTNDASKLFVTSYDITTSSPYVLRNMTLELGTSNPTVTINGSSVPINGTYTAIARTKSVNVIASPTDLRDVKSITGTTNLEDDLNIITITMSDNTVYNVYVMVLRNCFLEGTKILCYIDDEEKYIPIEQMKPGILVKTPNNGYVAVNTIGHSKIYNPADKLRGENRLYKRTSKDYPELIEDLIVTGCHSVLVEDDRITPEIREKTKELFKHEIMLTDKKIRLLTCLDELAEPYEEEGVFTIWHFALEHFDDYMNYGVWANGLLMETCSINMMRQYSGLELV
jgi:hypothetical protein